MPSPDEKSNILTLNVKIKPEFKTAFVDWQAKINTQIARFPGFVSLEILSPLGSKCDYWVLVQRFINEESATNWKNSKEHEELLKELSTYSDNLLDETADDERHLQNGITEVFVTQVAPEKEDIYRAWIAKVHHVEAKFPGFKGVYVQSPINNHSHTWITFLQFDTPENLDKWLASPEREEIVREAQPLITNLESYRVISSYGGWFSQFAKEEGELPPEWKQTMLVLLVLFPIIMLEFKFLSPQTKDLNISLATFIGNALSVTLIAWPGMPIAIRLLGWWLVPKGNHRQALNYLGTAILFLLYLTEITLFWSFV